MAFASIVSALAALGVHGERPLQRLPHQFVNSSLVFFHGEPGSDYKCIRIPSVVAAGPLLLAFAEGRRWYGDGCCPSSVFPVPGVCVNSSFSSSKHSEAAAGTECHTDTVMKASSDLGITWGALSVAAPCAGNPNVLVSEKGGDIREVLVYVGNT